MKKPDTFNFSVSTLQSLKNKNILKTGIFLNIIYILQTLVAIGTQIVIAAYYGTSGELDAYIIAATIPTTIFFICSTSILIAIITFYNEQANLYGEENTHGLASNIFWLLIIFGITFYLFIYFFAPEIINIIAPGLSSKRMILSVKLLKVISPTLIFFIAIPYINGLFNLQGIFYLPSILALSQNVTIIIITLIFGKFGIESLAFAFLIGTALNFIISILFLSTTTKKIGFLNKKYKKYFKRFFKLLVPVLGGVVFIHCIWIMERYFASFEKSGSISALSYAQRITSILAYGISYGIRIITIPVSSSLFESGKIDEIKRINKSFLKFIAFIGVIIAILIIFFARPFIEILFERGNFGPASVKQTALACKLYLGVFISYIFDAIFEKTIAGAKKMRLILLISAVTFIFYIIITSEYIKYFGFIGIPLGASTAFLLKTLLFCGFYFNLIKEVR